MKLPCQPGCVLYLCTPVMYPHAPFFWYRYLSKSTFAKVHLLLQSRCLVLFFPDRLCFSGPLSSAKSPSGLASHKTDACPKPALFSSSLFWSYQPAPLLQSRNGSVYDPGSICIIHCIIHPYNRDAYSTDPGDALLAVMRWMDLTGRVFLR